jgi:hypothetical protein
MVKQGLAQFRGKPHTAPGGKVLGRKGKTHAQDHQGDQGSETFQQERFIPIPQAPVDHGGDHQGHRQVHQGFQQFKSRCQQTVPGIALKVWKK